MLENDRRLSYDPANWYWRRADGALFSSARIAFVSEGDPDFIAWLFDGGVPTPWPKDTEGNESQAELEAVLGAHGLWASLESYAADARYQLEVSGVIVTIAGEGVLVSTARDNRDGLRDTQLALLTGLRQDGDALKVFADRVSRPATNAEAAAVVAAAYGHVQAAFNREIAVVAQLADKVITTKEEVVTAFLPA